MTITDFSRDIVPIISVVIGFFSLASILLLWWQIRQFSIWNRIQARRSLVPDGIYSLLRSLHEGAKKSGVNLRDRTTPLDDRELELIWNEEEAYYPLLRFLHEMETIAMEVKAGTVDVQFAYSAHLEGVTKNYQIYEKAVQRFRQIYGNDDIFIEWQHLAEEWTLKRKQELEEREKKRVKMERQLAKKTELIGKKNV